MKSERWGRVPTFDKNCKWIARNENDMGCNKLSPVDVDVPYKCGLLLLSVSRVWR